MRHAVPLLLAALPALAQEGEPPNFADHVAPILRESCLSCHRGSRARNGLELRSLASILKGGSSGPALVPGDPQSSLLYLAMSHQREPFMPPEEPPLEDEVLALVEAWIAGGARASAEDEGTAAAEPAGPTFVPPPSVGAAVMPEGLPTQPVWWSERADAITTLAASPTAPLVAVPGHRQVALYRVPEGELVGVLPFPEGKVTSLRFAASGALLVAGGGRPADRGLAVGWDVKTGARVFELGDEPDVALDADVTVDHGLVALGGPDRMVRTYSARTGELLYELGEHTDWVTAVAFSPDGVLLATGDRAGGLFVWEALTGREFHALPAQRGPVTALSWRADSMLVVVGGDDGRVRSFEMERGRRVREFRAHDGVLGLQLLPSGDGVSCGRNGQAALWKENGRARQVFAAAHPPATAVCATGDGEYVVVGDIGGAVRVFPADQEQPLATLRPNPATDEERAVTAAHAALPGLEAAIAPAEEALGAAREELARSEETLVAATSEAQAVASRVEPARQTLAAAEQELATAAAQLARYAEPQTHKDAAQGEAAAHAAALERAASEARARVDAALTRAVAAEEAVVLAADDAALTALEEARAVANELLRGATARTQLAASRAAEARVGAEVARMEAEAWRARGAPALAAHQAARARAAELRGELERAGEAARSAEQVAADARTDRDAAAAAVTAAEARVGQAHEALRAGREAVPRAEAAWESLRAELEANGGKMPGNGAPGS